MDEINSMLSRAGGSSRPTANPSGSSGFAGFSGQDRTGPPSASRHYPSPADAGLGRPGSPIAEAGRSSQGRIGSPPRATRDFSIRDLKIHSFAGHLTFFYFHPDLSVEDGRGVFLDGAWHAITRHSSDAAFRINPKGATRDLLITPISALDSVRAAFSREPLDRVKVGSAPRAISYPVDSLPLMHSLFQVLRDRDRLLVMSVLEREYSAFTRQMEDFKPLVGVALSEGWDVCPAFEAFAKPVQIDCREAAVPFNTPVPPFVPEKFLKLELDRRNTVVDFLSSFTILFRQAASLEKSASQSMARLAYTAIRGLLPAFQQVLFAWMTAKTDCRKIFLQDSASPYAFTLLSSSPWTPSLFPLEVVLELTRSPALGGRSLLEQMGWTEARHHVLKTRQRELDTRLPGLLPSSSGGSKRPSGPSSHRGSSASHSYRRPAKRGRWDSPRHSSHRGSRKPPFRGARGSRGNRGASSSARGSASKQSRS